jgi:hypothetical protein
VCVISRQRATQLWPHLHSVLDFVLDSRAVYACQHTPYLVERCIITVLRAGIHMLDIPEISARVCESLRLLRAIPVDISRFISDRLGAGLLTLIKVAPHNQSSEEQWYLLFALLGAAASVRDFIRFQRLCSFRLTDRALPCCKTGPARAPFRVGGHLVFD